MEKVQTKEWRDIDANKPLQLGRHDAPSSVCNIKKTKKNKLSLTGSGNLLDLVQNVSLHVWMGADLFPVSYDASLHGECGQLLLVGHHKADDVVLVTKKLNRPFSFTAYASSFYILVD